MTQRALALVLLVACNDEQHRPSSGTVSRERSEVVQATGPGAGSSPPSASQTAPQEPPTAPRAARKVCEGQLGKPGRDIPKRALSHQAAPGGRALSVLPTGNWTWINLWAAWCGPCKEELPRLVGFARRQAQTGHPVDLVLLSLDDDERQLQQFLAQQTSDATRSTYWLREGRERDEWLSAAGLPRDPGLPVQLLVDPKGKVRCVVNGSVDDADLPEMALIVGSR